MKTTAMVPRVKVSADGAGVVSHAGVGMLRELADLTGQVSAVLADTYKGPWLHDPGRMYADLAAAVADGADSVSGIGTLIDQQAQHGPVASVTTAWRLIDGRVDAAHLTGVKQARAVAREVAWAAGAAPPAGVELVMDVDATITIDHSDGKQNSASTWKKTYGFHPLLVFLDRPDIAGGEALAGLLRAGNAGSNTTADHIAVLTEALAALPEAYRPRPDDPAGADGPRLLIRSDSAGATHGFAAACRKAGVSFSFGFPVTAPVRDAVATLVEAESVAAERGWTVWYPAIERDGSVRDGARLAEATGLVDLSAWPPRTRLILRKERPHPGAQLTFADQDGHRVTAFITDTPIGAVPGQLAGLDLRHRRHARVEDRIRQAKATGLRNLPCFSFASNSAWLEIVLTATDLLAWCKLIAFIDEPDLACCEVATFRYRVLHVAARIGRAARKTHLRIDRTWRWATAIATGWHRIRAAFT
ncbi:IS1380 family transposase [Nakamurella multipartita]|uniref:Transposase IS4 family protein n=1 Tax=Nakamurella multipartita (strain ATCC 700099 / DSM 44233 / CIP 104796 / JCM 9543 / NBRC 105858 / Y-104) TaxID=479431 RepID=C8XKV6_NAKMY|nr:IS1380 family transposase [Nakamurella multipartita]ACV80763.1 transposase IS4 family protein [Nakamurella multipartita DSM 44233]